MLLVTLILASLNNYFGAAAEELKNLPTFDMTTSQNITVTAGLTARLPCIIANLNDKQVTWMMRGATYPLTVSNESFRREGRHIVEREGNYRWNLLIRESRDSDTGVYQCRITTRTMLLLREVYLTVVPSQDNPYAVMMELGEQLTLSCNISDPQTGLDTPSSYGSIIKWYKDGEMIDSTAETSILITNYIREDMVQSQLTVDQFDIKDIGTYVCTSGNKTYVKFHVDQNFERKMSQDQPIADTNSHATRDSWSGRIDSGEITTGNRSGKVISFPMYIPYALVLLYIHSHIMQR